jgi:HJR/Mrr/RecB family endonuclease
MSMSGAICQHEYTVVATHSDPASLRKYETLYCRKCFEFAGRFVGESKLERPPRFFPFDPPSKEKFRVAVVFNEGFRRYADDLFSRLAADPSIDPFGLNTIHPVLDVGALQMLRSAVPNSDLIIFVSAPKHIGLFLSELAPTTAKPVLILSEERILRTEELHLLSQGFVVMRMPPVQELYRQIKGYAPSIAYEGPQALIQVPKFKIEMASLAEQMALALEKDPGALDKMHHRKFEELVAELMEKDGYSVELTPQSRDGGVDIYAVRSDAYGRFLVIVDCKKYSKDNPIGPELVRTLFGTLNFKNASHGVIATTTRFTKDAREEASQCEFRISLKDHADVLSWIQKHRLSS